MKKKKKNRKGKKEVLKMNFIRTLLGTFDQWSNQENVLERGKGYIDNYLYGHSFKRPKDEGQKNDVHGGNIGASLSEDEHSGSSSPESTSTDDTSWIDRLRKASDDIRREIILRNRRQKKQNKKQAKAEFYRNKYRTNGNASSAEGVAKENTTEHKRFSRLFNAIQTRITGRDENESRPVRDRVALKLAQRRRVYEGCSREEIRADIRQKYFK